MAVVPTIESVLLEVLQALDLDELHTKKKTKFKTRQMSLGNHQQMIVEVFHDICRELNLDPQAEVDLVYSLLEAGAFQLELENSVWTFGADQRQVLWYVLGYTWMPFLGRKIAFWQLDATMDPDMPGGAFWYLPQVQQKDGKPELRMPVANVLDWLFDLSEITVDKMSCCLGGGYNDRTEEEEDTPLGIESNLTNWRKGKLPRAANIASMFRDGCEIPFKGTFTVDRSLSLQEKFEAAKQFIKRKGLTPEALRGEIPMTSPGAIEQVLAGHANDEVKAHFICILANRYARPTMETIRKRLYLARAVQHGFRKLVKSINPGLEETCADPYQNKALQLLEIYKFIYNLTVQAHVECSTVPEENAWFESHLPPWFRSELFYAILPSLNSDSRRTAQSVGVDLSRRFADLKGGDELEDFFGWDKTSTAEIARREIQRLKNYAEKVEDCKRLKRRIRLGSPWRTLQTLEDYEVIRSLLQDANLPQKTRRLVLNRLREVAISPIQKVGVILQELDDHLNSADRKDKNCKRLVEVLINELEASRAVEVFRAELLRHKAKHALFQNQLKSSENYLREALELSNCQNRGRQRGEIARDLFSILVATQGLIPNNHEKYFRYALFSDIFEVYDFERLSLENAAEIAAMYFWEDLYKPYRGVEHLSRRL